MSNLEQSTTRNLRGNKNRGAIVFVRANDDLFEQGKNHTYERHERLDKAKFGFDKLNLAHENQISQIRKKRMSCHMFSKAHTNREFPVLWLKSAHLPSLKDEIPYMGRQKES